MPSFVTSLSGIASILAVALLLSSDRQRICLRAVCSAFAMQALVAFLVLRTAWGEATI